MKLTRLSTLALTFFMLGTFSTCGIAQVQRVAIVNAARVLKETIPAIEAKQRVEREFSGREKEIANLSDELKKQTEKFDSEVLNLTDLQRSQRRSKLAEQSREFQKKRNALLEDKNTAMRNVAQNMIALAKKVVRQVAEAEKFDLVLQDAVYVNPEFDITEKVIAGINSEPVQ
jgi:outer membrane protein